MAFEWLEVLGRRHLETRQVLGVWVVIPSRDGAYRAPLSMPLHRDGTEHAEGYEWGYGGAGPQALAHALLGLSLGCYQLSRRLIQPSLVGPRGMSEAIRIRGYRPPHLVRESISKLPTGGGFRFMRRELDDLVERSFDPRTVRY